MRGKISSEGQMPVTVYAPSWLAITRGEQEASTSDENPHQGCQLRAYAGGLHLCFWGLSILCFPCIRRANTRRKGGPQSHG